MRNTGLKFLLMFFSSLYENKRNTNLYQFRLIAFFLIGLVCSTSCKKEEGTVSVSGRVINLGTQQPIEGVTVVIENEVSFTPSQIDSTVTNANGDFSIELNNEENAWIYLRKEGWNFHSSNKNNVTGYLTYYSVGTTANVKLEMYPDAWFNGKFLSSNPSPEDTMFFSALPYGEPIYYGGGGRIRLGVGPHEISAVEPGSLIRGDMFFRYGINYTKNGEWFVKVDSVYVSAFATYSDTIYY